MPARLREDDRQHAEEAHEEVVVDAFERVDHFDAVELQLVALLPRVAVHRRQQPEHARHAEAVYRVEKRRAGRRQVARVPEDLVREQREHVLQRIDVEKDDE